MSSVTFQFDFFGLSYFLLFLMHGFAYFALRTSDEPIDALLNKRGNKFDIKLAFGILFVFATGFTLFFVVVGKCIYHFRSKPEETGVEGHKFADDLLDVIDYAIPDYDTLFTLLQDIILFLSSLVYLRTRKYENEEAETYSSKSHRAVDEIRNIEKMKTFQVSKAVQLIKDYKFKQHLTIYTELFLLAVLTSSACTILIIPYMLLYLVLILVLAFNSSQKPLLKVSKFLTLIFIALLVVDLPTKYVIRSGHYATEEGYDSYLTEAIGLLSSTPTHFEFYFKIALYLIECQKIRYVYDYQTTYEQIRASHSEKSALSKLFRKKKSISMSLFKTTAIFFFCIFGLVFSLLHPSIILLSLLPLLIYSFFLNVAQFRGFSKMFVFIFCVYNVTTYTFRLVYILLPSSQTKENSLTYIENIFGFRRTQDNLTDVFPGKLDFCFVLVLSFLSYVVQKQYKENLINEQDRRNIDQYDDGQIDEDLLTIPDDQSEVRSRISHRMRDAQSERSVFLSRQRQPESNIPNQNEEERKEGEDESAVFRNAPVNNSFRKKSMFKDTTTRTKMRRWFYKIYTGVKSRQNFFDLFIIHSPKIALLAIFIVSVIEANVLNAVLFVMFLFVSLMGFATVKKYWRLTIFIDSLILIGQYVVDIFQNDFVRDISKETQDIIGIEVNSQNETKLREYCPYLILLAILVMADYILHSQKYEDFLEIYQVIEQEEEVCIEGQQYKESSQDSAQSENQNLLEDTPQSQKPEFNQIGVSDFVTKLITKISIYLLIIALFISCMMLPVSLLNCILLIFMSIITIIYLGSDSTYQMYQKLTPILTFLKWTSLLVLTTKYMFQFQDYTEHLDEKSEQELRDYYDDLPLVRRLFGMENSHVVIKLLSQALVMSITNYQEKFLTYRYLADILREQDKEWDRAFFLDKDHQTKFQRAFHLIKVYGLFTIFYGFLPLPIVFLYRYALKYVSVIGFLIVITSLIIMHQQRTKFWTRWYYPIGIVACLIIIVDYGVQFAYLSETVNRRFINWFGVRREDKEVTATYGQLVPAFTIIIICAVQKEAVRLSNLFQLTVTQEDLQRQQKEDEQEAKALKEQEQQQQISVSDKDKDEVSDQADGEEKQKKEEKEQPKEEIQIQSEKYLRLKTIFEYEEPIFKCLRFRDHYMKIFGFMYSYHILIFISLVVIFYKRNIISLFYSLLLIHLMRTNYYPLRFGDNPESTYLLQKSKFRLNTYIFMISILMVGEYFLLIGPADEFDYTSWKDHFSTYFCYKDSEICYQDWKEWLTIKDSPKGHIIVSILLLFSCYLVNFFWSGQIQLSDDQIVQYPQLRDQKDFSTERSGKKMRNLMYFFIFNGFPYAFITYLLIFAATFHGAGATDFISTAYLFFAMYYIIQFRKLYTQNSALLKYLRYYNFVVLVALVTFQAPTFVCPTIETYFKDDHYIGRGTCADLELGNLEKLDKSQSRWLALYIVFSQSMGLVKIDGVQWDLTFLILFTELLNHIFHHPYYHVYVLQQMKEEKETDGKLRAFMFVERSHLYLKWSYKAIKEEIKILHQRLVRVNKTIRSQEFSRHLVIEDDEDSNDRSQLLEDDRATSHSALSQNILHPLDINQQLIQEDSSSIQPEDLISVPNNEEPTNQEIEKILDRFMNELENICLDLLAEPDRPVVPMDLFLDTLELKLRTNRDFLELVKNGQDSDEVKNVIKEQLISTLRILQKQIHHKDRIDLYYKEGIGMNFAIQKGSTELMTQSDFKFYQHLILGEKIERIQIKAQDELEENKNENNQAIEAIPNESQNQEFEVKEVYENLSVIEEKIHHTVYQKRSVWTKMSHFFRQYLWNNFINKQMFYSITQRNQKQVTLDKIPFLRLITSSILSQSQNIAYMMLFINFIINTNLISLFPALSALLYAMLDYPSPNVKYWKFLMIYMLVTVTAKFLYQLPIFCGTPAYEFYSIDACDNYPVLDVVLVNRIDYIIGVHKFAGPSSFPKEQGILSGMTCDVLVLFTLMILKNYLIKIGQWNFVKNQPNIYQNPAFKCKIEELTEVERLNMISQDNFRIYQYEQSNFIGKAKIKINQFIRMSREFYLKLLPAYMKPYQKNLDTRTQQEIPLITHSAKKVKPGRSYFASNFFSLLLIFIFNLFWYRNVTGDNKSEGLTDISLDRFSVLQVLILFFILLLMLVERMLFRVRYFDRTNQQVQSGILAKHQLSIKLGIYIFLVIGVHLYLGFLIKTSYFDNVWKKMPVIISYLLWIYHLISSALQIRYGYPQNAFKPPFTRDTSALKVWAFRVYKALPFLWEMKVIIDWTVTATCLDLFQWFKLDDAFNYLYANQYQNDDRKNRPEFAQRNWQEKFFQGFCFAFGLILIILAPILLFSGFNPILIQNPVQSASLQVSFELNSNGNIHTILQTQAFNIRNLRTDELQELSKLFAPINVKYAEKNLQTMRFSPYSEQEWLISPPSLQKFIQEYNENKNNNESYIDVKSIWSFRRNDPIGNEITMADTTSRMRASRLQPIIDMLSPRNNSRPTAAAEDSNTTNITQSQVQSVPTSSIFVESIFPKVFRLGADQKSSNLEVQELQDDFSEYSSAFLTLRRDLNQQGALYWTYTLTEEDQRSIFRDQDKPSTADDKDQIIVVYNDEVIGSLFGSSFEFSIVGLYATIVIAIGRFLRIIFDRISQRVMYEEMPDPELLFEICEGIFIAQLE